MAHDGNNFQEKGRRLINLQDPLIQDVLPQYFSQSFPKFISLLERYYEFENDSASPTELLRHLYETRDVNQTDLALLTYIEDELLLGQSYVESFADKRAAANFSSELFRAKGTKFSIEWFFRSFFGIDPEIFYPKQNVFTIASEDSATLTSTLGPDSLKYITNDELYQTFALQIKSTLPVTEWEDLYKLFVHPAGMYLGAKFLLTDSDSLPALDSSYSFIGTSTSPWDDAGQFNAIGGGIRTYPSSTYYLLADDSTPTEGQTINFTVGGANIDSEYYWWYVDPITIHDSDILGYNGDSGTFLDGPNYPTDSAREAVFVENDSGDFTITLNYNVDSESVKQFNVYLTDEPSPGAIDGARGIVGGPVTISINDLYYEMADNGPVDEGSSVTFTVTGTNIPDGNVQLSFENLTPALTAADFDDPIPDSAGSPWGALTISGGTGNRSYQVKADTTTEQPAVQRFTARLYQDSTGDVNVLGYKNGGGNLVTINDTSVDPAGYTLSVTPSNPEEGITGQDLDVVVTGSDLFTPGDSDVFIDFTFGTASAADFDSAPPGTGAIPRRPLTITSTDGGVSGSGTSASIARISVDSDGVDAGGETFSVHLYQNDVGGTAVASSGTITIQNTTFAITVPSGTTANEGDIVTFNANGTNFSSSGTAYWQMNFIGTDSADFVNHPPQGQRQAVSLNSGATPDGSWSVQIAEDFLDDSAGGNEFFQTSLWTAPTGGTQLAISPTVTVTNSSVPTGAAYTVSANDTTEGSFLTFTVYAGTSSGDLIDWTITGTGDSATAITDRVNTLTGDTGGTVVTSRVVNVPTTVDSDLYTLLNNGLVTIDINGGATGVDDDTFSVTDASAAYVLSTDSDRGSNTFGEGDTIDFSVRGTNIPDGTIYIEFVGGTATSGDFTGTNPYDARQSIATVRANNNPAGGKNGTYSIAIDSDATTEGSETFNVQLWSLASGGVKLDSAGPFTILDLSTGGAPTVIETLDVVPLYLSNPYTAQSISSTLHSGIGYNAFSDANIEVLVEDNVGGDTVIYLRRSTGGDGDITNGGNGVYYTNSSTSSNVWGTSAVEAARLDGTGGQGWSVARSFGSFSGGNPGASNVLSWGSLTTSPQQIDTGTNSRRGVELTETVIDNGSTSSSSTQGEVTLTFSKSGETDITVTFDLAFEANVEINN